MEEKTAKIPSLKDFKDSQKEKKAQSKRSSSMQTKKQLRQSMEKSKSESAEKKKPPMKKTPAKNSASKKTTAISGETKVIDRVKAPEKKDVHRTPSKSTETNRTYVRDRLKSESSGHSDSYEKSSSELNKYRSQSTSYKDSKVRASVDDKPLKTRSAQKGVSRKAIKFRSFVIYSAIVLAVIIVGLILSLTVLFKTEAFEISGNSIYSDEKIIEVSGINIGENIFLAGKNKAEENIKSQLPYVEDVKVSFKMPDTITIEVTMAEPAFFVESSGEFYVASAEGKILEITATDDEIDVPVLEGASVKGKSAGETVEYSSDAVKEAMGEIFAAFSEYECRKVSCVIAPSSDESSKNYKYVYDDRIVVYLGIADHLNYKIHSAHKVITDKIDVNNSTVAGELDASGAFDNSTCYFNEYTLLPENVAPTKGEEETTEAETLYE